MDIFPISRLASPACMPSEYPLSPYIAATVTPLLIVREDKRYYYAHSKLLLLYYSIKLYLRKIRDMQYWKWGCTSEWVGMITLHSWIRSVVLLQCVYVVTRSYYCCLDRQCNLGKENFLTQATLRAALKRFYFKGLRRQYSLRKKIYLCGKLRLVW